MAQDSRGVWGDAVVQRTYPVNANGQAAAAGDVPEGWWAIVANNDASHALVPEVWVICARP